MEINIKSLAAGIVLGVAVSFTVAANHAEQGWAHVRRDFLDAAKKYSGELKAWAMSWIEEIGELYRLYKARAKKMEESAEEYPDLCEEEKVRVVAAAEQEALEAHVMKMKERWKGVWAPATGSETS